MPMAAVSIRPGDALAAGHPACFSLRLVRHSSLLLRQDGSPTRPTSTRSVTLPLSSSSGGACFFYHGKSRPVPGRVPRSGPARSRATAAWPGIGCERQLLSGVSGSFCLAADRAGRGMGRLYTCPDPQERECGISCSAREIRLVAAIVCGSTTDFGATAHLAAQLFFKAGRPGRPIGLDARPASALPAHPSLPPGNSKISRESRPAPDGCQWGPSESKAMTQACLWSVCGTRGV